MKKLSVLVFAISIAGSTASGADMPTWYPQMCVSVDYCAPVSGAEWSGPVGSTPRLRIRSAFGNAVLQKDFAVEASGDNRSHVCMRYDPFGDLEVTCLLVPVLMQ